MHEQNPTTGQPLPCCSVSVDSGREEGEPRLRPPPRGHQGKALPVHEFWHCCRNGLKLSGFGSAPQKIWGGDPRLRPSPCDHQGKATSSYCFTARNPIGRALCLHRKCCIKKLRFSMILINNRIRCVYFINNSMVQIAYNKKMNENPSRDSNTVRYAEVNY